MSKEANDRPSDALFVGAIAGVVGITASCAFLGAEVGDLLHTEFGYGESVQAMRSNGAGFGIITEILAFFAVSGFVAGRQG